MRQSVANGVQPSAVLVPLLALFISLLHLAQAARAADPSPGKDAGNPAAAGWTKDDAFTAPRAEWFRDGKYGMFIHWGLYAVPAGEYKGQRDKDIGEWIMHHLKIPVAEYETFAGQFNPTKFNADEWAQLAQDAGMKYVVLTSKHHDGFCIWPTKVTPYNIADATPFGRDPVKELSEACKKRGIKLCFYHSIMDWHHPELKGYWDANKDAATDPNDPRVRKYIEGQLKPQLKELVTWYDPGMIWFDGEWVPWWTQEYGREIEQYLHSLKPDILVNNRIGKRKMTDGDYETPEQEIPRAALGKRMWETCMTLNDTWGYKHFDQNWKQPEDVIHKLADIVGKGGNFLLNVGPTAEGVIPEQSQKILREAGKWVHANSEALYGTTFATPAPVKWGSITRKGNNWYLIVFDWPRKGQPLEVPAATPAKKARLLNGDGRVDIVDTGDRGTALNVPAEMPTQPATVVVLEFEGEPKPLTTAGQMAGEVIPASIDRTYTLLPGAAKLKGATLQVEPGGNLGHWTRPDEYAEWLIEVTNPGRYEVEMTYAVEPGAGGPFAVQAGDKQITARAEPTGGQQYKTVKVGEIDVPAGRVSITVRPTGDNGKGLMNLQAVKLTPVK